MHLRKFSLPGLLWVYRYYMRPPDDGWYAALFAAGGGKTTGEITPNYSVLDREQIAHVHEIMPEAKIVFLMRNPIERAWSQTVMYFDKKEGRRVEEVREEEFLDFTRSQSSLHTDYLRTLENWGLSSRKSRSSSASSKTSTSTPTACSPAPTGSWGSTPQPTTA